MQNKPRLFAVLIKATMLFLLFDIAFIFVNSFPLGKLSLYNVVFQGRERFPFGETRESYNLSLFDVDAMFASHMLNGTPKAPDEYRVLLMGDSSVWGILLKPEETLAGQLNSKSLAACGKNIRAYNLGYPTISLTKDLILMDQAQQYQPDLIIWLTTLEAFPKEKQFDSPMVANNTERIQRLIAKYRLVANASALIKPSTLDQTFVSQRRALADLIRLQMDGALWSSTGIDQVYPQNYEHAQIDLQASDDFHKLKSLDSALALDVLEAGMSSSTPILLINEPILVSSGKNSDIRYDFYYPRWAYDQYRQILNEHAIAENWNYLDLWNIVPMNEFTNSAIHLTPSGEALLASRVAEAIQASCR